MATEYRTLLEAFVLPDAETSIVLSTATTVRVSLDRPGVTNITAGAVVLSISLVPASGTASDENRVLFEKSIGPGETYALPELAGKTLQPGAFISTLADTADALVMHISGRSFG